MEPQSLPNRYMRSPVEVVPLPDLDHAAGLLVQFALGLNRNEDFTPWLGRPHSRRTAMRFGALPPGGVLQKLNKMRNDAAAAPPPGAPAALTYTLK